MKTPPSLTPSRLTLTRTLIAVTLALLTACGSPNSTVDPNTPVQITDASGTVMSLQAAGVNVFSGESLRVSWLPSTTWTTSDPKVLSVQTAADGTSNVQAIGVGTATLNGVYTPQSSLTVKLQVSVKAGQVTGISVTPGSASLTAGTTQSLTATLTGRGSYSKTVNWKSSNAAIASVNANGVVSANAPGSATITATSAQDSTQSASAAITVTAPAPTPATVTGVTISPSSAALTVGATQTLTSTVSGSGSYSTGVTWKSSNSSVASVTSSGLVTALAAGSATITATSTQDTSKSGSATLTVTAPTTPAPTPSDPFNITIVFPANDGLTATQRQAFQTAAARWEKVIATGLPDATGVTVGSLTMNVDDLAIEASGVAIDGVGSILGKAGPTSIRSSGLPLSGKMQFDSADLANMEAGGTLTSVIMHEMGHVLGIGSLWSKNVQMNATTCTSATQVKYTGAGGLREYQNLGGQVAWVPVEDQYSTGTKCGHWKESVFKTELMTGFASSGAMPLSRITVGALADLGYQVNYANADTFTLPSLTAQGIGDTHKIGEEILLPDPVPYPGAK